MQDDTAIAKAMGEDATGRLIKRVVELYPENFVGVCQLPQSPGVPVSHSVQELERCVKDLDFKGALINGHTRGRFLDDQVWLENRRVMDLLRGIEATAIRLRGVRNVRPGFRWGLWSGLIHAALDAGEVVQLERIRTIADGLATPNTGRIVLEHARTLVDDVVLVSDDDIIRAMLFLLERSKIMTEPAGAAAVAAMLAGRISFPAGSRVVAILSGGNIDLSRLRTLLPER